MTMNKNIKSVIIGVLTAIIITAFYIVPAMSLSYNQPPVLDDNWWNALNWIKNNTAECATIATYWDFGSFITGIARRPVVFDGASQNAQLTKPYNGTESGVQIIPYDNGIQQIVLYGNGNETRARIKDITTVMLTANETLAVDILRDYVKPNCSELYFIASADLIYKSQWWSYFATWNPTRDSTTPLSMGDIYTYMILQRSQTRALVQYNATGMTYPISGSQSITLCQKNNTIAACSDDVVGLLQQDSQFVRIQKVVWMQSDGWHQLVDDDAELKGTVMILDSNAQTIAYMIPPLENSIFTKMFFYNGAGLENFELIGNWGGEVKLFRVKL